MFVKQFVNAIYKPFRGPVLATLALVAFFNLALVGSGQATSYLNYGDDGYMYAWNGSNWVFSGGNSRTFPDPANSAVYDLSVDGVLYERWDFGYRPGYAGVYSYATETWQQYPMTSAYDPYRVYAVHPDGYVSDLGSALAELIALLNQLQAAIAQDNANAAAQAEAQLEKKLSESTLNHQLATRAIKNLHQNLRSINSNLND